MYQHAWISDQPALGMLPSASSMACKCFTNSATSVPSSQVLVPPHLIPPISEGTNPLAQVNQEMPSCEASFQDSTQSEGAWVRTPLRKSDPSGRRDSLIPSRSRSAQGGRRLGHICSCLKKNAFSVFSKASELLSGLCLWRGLRVYDTGLE